MGNPSIFLLFALRGLLEAFEAGKSGYIEYNEIDWKTPNLVKFSVVPEHEYSLIQFLLENRKNYSNKLSPSHPASQEPYFQLYLTAEKAWKEVEANIWRLSYENQIKFKALVVIARFFHYENDHELFFVYLFNEYVESTDLHLELQFLREPEIKSIMYLAVTFFKIDQKDSVAINEEVLNLWDAVEAKTPQYE
ncbi:hypothetical protein L596_023279 [Steinernema carpocapsae]|uniref:Uncharacterized protein n=1 Tax=Steinernema carpocapsae TaxID=34508 RepID=A0A4U5MDE0_STECR|nr:hypothetical protein L596_023279 [Steinernema carpocapsae]